MSLLFWTFQMFSLFSLWLVTLNGDSCPVSRTGVIQSYECRHLGVAAKAVLDTNRRYATVSLSGIVLGGKLEGNGWILDPSFLGAVGENDAKNGGMVILDVDFEYKLRKRGIVVRDALLNRTTDTLVVTVSIPIFGLQRIILHRTPLLATAGW